MPPSTVIAAIIAGGRGERLGGTIKSLVSIRGRAIIDRQLEALLPLFSRVVLVAADDPRWAPVMAAHASGLALVRDRVGGGAGPLAGLDAALAALAPTEESVVCVAADMPLLAPGALALLRDHAPGAAAVVPFVNGYPEPLFARYHRSCAPAVAGRLAAGHLRTSALLDDLVVNPIAETVLRAVDPDLRSLINVNTPADHARVEALLAATP